MKNKLIQMVLALVFATGTLVSCGTGTAIVFSKEGIQVVPGDSFIVPGTETPVEDTK